MFLCRHVVHLQCVDAIEGEGLPEPPDTALAMAGLTGASMEDDIGERITL
jgi:hypothetical protein